MEDKKRIICLCLNVSYADIVDAVDRGARSFTEVQQMTGCGKSCAMCQPALRQITEALLRERGRACAEPDMEGGRSDV